ncbi:MAG TPA: hypothetical protein VGT04_02260, partial [Acidobacteriaceae bacterium]|nr:hypothetical protein [Acidobacteriaceae bacterium]
SLSGGQATTDVIPTEESAAGVPADRSSSVGWEANEVEGPALNDASTTTAPEDQEPTEDRYEALKDKTLFVGMTHKPPSVAYTYELRDRIIQRMAEFNARKQAREQANAQVVS